MGLRGIFFKTCFSIMCEVLQKNVRKVKLWMKKRGFVHFGHSLEFESMHYH